MPPWLSNIEIPTNQKRIKWKQTGAIAVIGKGSLRVSLTGKKRAGKDKIGNYFIE